jgi:hypothetical protein
MSGGTVVASAEEGFSCQVARRTRDSIPSAVANFTVAYVNPGNGAEPIARRYRGDDSYLVLPSGALQVESSNDGSVTRVIYAPTAWISVTEDPLSHMVALRRRRATDQ